MRVSLARRLLGRISRRRLRSLQGLVSIGFLAGVLSYGAAAEQVQVRHPEGTVHGYLSLRSEEGTLLAAGDLIQTVRGSVVTAHMIFHFKDGSLDDETTVFSQRGRFQMISDHHVQKGPFFEHPIDMTVDARKGQVTVHSADKDGKDSVSNDHMKLDPDVVSGLMIIPIAKNLGANAAETDVQMVVATPKPRLVKLVFTADGEDGFSLGGFERKALHYQIKFDLGGVAGFIAPMIGKQPPNIDVWVEGGEVPAFVKEEGPLAADGPVVIIQQTGPVGPGAESAGSKK
jgi:hypothetical protein